MTWNPSLAARQHPGARKQPKVYSLMTGFLNTRFWYAISKNVKLRYDVRSWVNYSWGFPWKLEVFPIHILPTFLKRPKTTQKHPPIKKIAGNLPNYGRSARYKVGPEPIVINGVKYKTPISGRKFMGFTGVIFTPEINGVITLYLLFWCLEQVKNILPNCGLFTMVKK